MKKNLFLFTGEETYLLQEQLNLWKKAFIEKHGDINLEALDAAQMPLNEVMASVTAMPFLGDKRLIFIHGLPDAPKIRNANKVSKKDEKRDEELKKLAQDLDQIPDSSVVVFVQSNPDKRKSFYKQLTKKAEVKEFNSLAGSTLTNWIQKQVQLKGGQISSQLAEYLVTLVGQNLWRLSTEIDKLTTHSPNQSIQREVIDHLVVPTVEANVFQLTDALALRDHKKAIYHLHRVMAAGENLQPVFYMIVRQFRLLLQGRAFLDKEANPTPTVFGTKLKLHPFVAKNTLGQARHFKLGELKKAYGELLEMDTGLKTSRIKVFADDQTELALAMECFMLGVCG